MPGRKGRVGGSMTLIRTRKRRKRAKNPVALTQDEFVAQQSKHANYSPAYRAWLDARRP